jgi:hypothetical protein
MTSKHTENLRKNNFYVCEGNFMIHRRHKWSQFLVMGT